VCDGYGNITTTDPDSMIKIVTQTHKRPLDFSTVLYSRLGGRPRHQPDKGFGSLLASIRSCYQQQIGEESAAGELR
jgi:hypothetical protein